MATRKSAKSKQPAEKPSEAPQGVDTDLEGEDQAQSLQSDPEPNLEASDDTPSTDLDDVPDTDAKLDPEPEASDLDMEGLTKPDLDEITCSNCGWSGPRSKLIADVRLKRQVYCPKCGTRHYDPEKDADHGYHQLQSS